MNKIKLFLWILMPAAGACGAWVLYGARWSAPPAEVPTSAVERGEYTDYIELRGEVEASSSLMVKAPLNAGDLQIVKLAPDGSKVAKGDVIVQFDTTGMMRQLEQNRSLLKQAEAEIERFKAEARISEEKIVTEVAQARYAVEKARLEAGKQEILSAIEGEKTRLALANAEQKMSEVEAKLASQRAADEADLESREVKRDKARFDVDQTERNLKSLTLPAPVDGVVTLQQNYRARTNFNASVPLFKEGDRAWSGAAIAEIPDLSTIRVAARVEETDRGRIETGQAMEIRVDAVPDREFRATVADISTLARLDYSSWPFRKNFDLTARLDQADERLRPGMSAKLRIAVEVVPGAILVPVEALFEKGGRTLAYVETEDGFEARPVEIARRGGARALVARGLKDGERVALEDPTGEEPLR